MEDSKEVIGEFYSLEACNEALSVGEEGQVSVDSQVNTCRVQF